MKRLNPFLPASRRRALVVSIAGSAILAAATIPLLSNVVVARGPFGDSSPYAVLSNERPWPPYRARESDYGPVPGGSASSDHRSWASGQAVCVRLCDGGFFPVSGHGDAASEEAACVALCPDAPTALYHEQAGSDKIEDAVSTKGAPYSALPVALRYRTTLDATCACHRSRAQQLPIARDSTLRKGDYVMTANGVVMFAGGSKRAPYGASDFTALAGASIPAAQRAALMAIERVSQSSGGISSNRLPIAPPPSHMASAAKMLNLSALQHPQPGVTPAPN